MSETEALLANLVDAVLNFGKTFHDPEFTESPEVVALKAKEHLKAKGWDWGD